MSEGEGREGEGEERGSGGERDEGRDGEEGQVQPRQTPHLQSLLQPFSPQLLWSRGPLSPSRSWRT